MTKHCQCFKNEVRGYFMDHQFRSATFGGFHRQDVLDYLEKSAAEHNQQVKDLEQKLDDARRRAQELEDGAAKLEQENELLAASAEGLKSRADTAEENLQQRDEQLTALQAEFDACSAKLKALEPDALAYATIKERATGVELDAHRRAEEALQDAEHRAQALRSQTEQWLLRVMREYDALRSRTDATIFHAVDELQKAGGMLTEVTKMMSRQDGALEELRRTYAATAEERKAPPVPLKED